jgi:hypothetical protein
VLIIDDMAAAEPRLIVLPARIGMEVEADNAHPFEAESPSLGSVNAIMASPPHWQNWGTFLKSYVLAAERELMRIMPPARRATLGTDAQ